MRGKLISFEGLDGSGKTITSLTVQELLEKQGKTVKYISFPQYNSSFFGPILKSVLYSTETPVMDVDPKLLTFLFAGDRFEAKEKINEWLDAGYTVIANRYVTSNIAYGMAKSSDEDDFRRFNEKFEYETCGIPKPDLVIYLDTPLEEIKSRLKCKDQDGYEKNFSFLETVRNCYIKLVEQCPEWKNVRTCNDEGQIMEPTEIASIIINKYI
jgi:dTMP kinase